MPAARALVARCQRRIAIEHEHDDGADTRHQRRDIAVPGRPRVGEGRDRAERDRRQDAQHPDPVGRVDLHHRLVRVGDGPARGDDDHRQREQRGQLEHAPAGAVRVGDAGALEEVGGGERDETEEQQSVPTTSGRNSSRTAIAQRTIAKNGPRRPRAARPRPRPNAKRRRVREHRPTRREQRAADDRAVEHRCPAASPRSARRTRKPRLTTSTTYAPIRKPSATRRYATLPEVANTVRAASPATTTPAPSTIPIHRPTATAGARRPGRGRARRGRARRGRRPAAATCRPAPTATASGATTAPTASSTTCAAGAPRPAPDRGRGRPSAAPATRVAAGLRGGEHLPASSSGSARALEQRLSTADRVTALLRSRRARTAIADDGPRRRRRTAMPTAARRRRRPSRNSRRRRS